MQTHQNISQTHLLILNHLNAIFSRILLSTNTYLFKQMKSNLEIPLYIIIEQRKISQITKDQNIIIQALKLCEFVKINLEKKMVQVIDYPTVKVQMKYCKKLRQIEKQLQSKYKYTINQIYQGNGDCLITIYKQNGWEILEDIMSSNGKLPYTRSLLYDEISQGVIKFKKNKKQLLNNQNYHKQKYSLDRPLQVFIRQAVDTDQQEQINHKIKNQEKQIHHLNSSQKSPKKSTINFEKQKQKKKYKQLKPVIINSDDFPTLK